jgi:hypothetical protein
MPEGRPAVERLQIVNVVSDKLKDVGKWDAATMAMEAQSYAETIPSYISMLFGGEQVDGFVNRFQDVAPGFIIYDVGSGPRTYCTASAPDRDRDRFG